ncbi:MAG TPA: TPM domain-containing protein [Gemmataceae bacterium]|nr:TPM domain-containing protein [Gemmataceae bacterium]
MSHRYRGLVCISALAGCLLIAGAAPSVAPEIRDDGKFFSAAAIKKADEHIRDIYRKYQRDVLIETIATVPQADMEKIKAMDAKGKAAYFLKWAKDRSGERVVNGIYVLICKEPRHLLVGINENEPRKFTPEIRAAVEDAFRKEFKEERYDSGLEMAIRVIEEKLAKK